MKNVYSIFETARVRVSIGWLLVAPTQFVGVSKSTAKCIWMREVSLIRIFEIPLERPYAGALALHLYVCVCCHVCHVNELCHE